MSVPSSLRDGGAPKRRSTFRWTRRRAIGAAIVLAIIVGVTAEVRRPERIAIDSDTLIINGMRPVLIGARLLNRQGRAIWHPWLKYSAVSPAIARSAKDGSVRCTGAGDGTLTISRGSLERPVLVRCRPILDVQTLGDGASLTLGGPPQELRLHAIGLDGRPVTLLRARAALRDSTVARLRGNLVYPAAIGFTLIDVEFSGGPTRTVGVSVTRTAIDTSLAMVAGEMRTWHLAPGYYELQLDALGEAADSLQLGAIGGNCARWRNGPQDYWCVMGDSSTLVVLNANPAGTRRARSAHLSAVQYPHAGTTPAARRVVYKR